jgi:hypothetical protein
MWHKLKNVFDDEISIAPLVTFRIVFGLLLFISTARFMWLGWIEDHYIKPVFHFKYFGFEWVEPLSSAGLYAVNYILLLASFCIIIGLFYRLATGLFFLGFTYTELIDLTYYLNHYYFVSVISFLLILVPPHRNFSLDVVRKPSLYCTSVPAWCINVFKFQIAIVYIYAGLIKINYDWLILALPMKIWLPASDAIPMLGNLFSWKYAPHIFSWMGMIYDATIIFWLMWRKTRPWAYITVIVFHTLVGILFQIGVFPLVMIGSTLIFFSAEWHQKWQAWFGNLTFPKSSRTSLVAMSKNDRMGGLKKNLISSFLIVFCLFQLLFPWRFILYPGNMYWTEQGYRFGWRVMLMEKAGTATFYVKDAKTGREGEVFNGSFLNPHQEKQMSMQPDMILQYAHFLGKHYEEQGLSKPEVRATVYVTLNARPSKLLIDSTVNLMTIDDGWHNKDWITK